jgi:hypothetical protein
MRLLRLSAAACLISLFMPFAALADAGGANQNIPATNCPPGYSGTYTCLRNPLGNTTSIPVIVGRIISAALGVVGSLALLMFIYGGFKWLTSGGSQDKVKEGTEVMKWALVGLVIVFASAALVRFVLGSFSTNLCGTCPDGTTCDAKAKPPACVPKAKK